MKILAFDCSSKTMCAAVSEGSEVLASAYAEENRNHAPFMLPMIEQVMSEAGVKYSDLEAIGVTVGPGSFTGLRIGLATAKGFSDTLNIPMAPIFSLDALAMGFQEYKNIIVTMLDARKNQVYAAVYDNTKGQMLKIMAETPLSPIDELASFLAKFPQVLFVGDGAPGWRQSLIDTYGQRCLFADDKPQGITGSSLTALTAAAKSWDYVRDIAPYYIRGVDAKAKFLRCNFQRLELGDLDDLLQVEKGSFSHPWTKQMFKDELKNNFAEYWIIRVDGKLVAYGGFWHIADESHITNIAVDPDYRHLGLGTLMVEHIINRGREKGVKGVTLEVRPSNTRAITLYENAGFQQRGRRPHYYDDNGEDAIIMWRMLADDTPEKPWR